jgi:hypothetical protein
MSKPMTITATLAAWMGDYNSPARFMEHIERGEHAKAANMLMFYGATEMASFGEGYIRMGEADVTVRLLPRDEQTRLAVKSLQAKLDELRAAYLTKQQEILDQINKLQAIEYVSEA